MNTTGTKLLLATMLATATISGAHAQERGNYLILGAGAAHSEVLYKGVESETTAFPFINLEYERFFIRGTNAGVELLGSGSIRLNAVFKPELIGYEPEESDYLSGMEEREWSLEGGFELGAKTLYGEGVLGIYSDLLGRHEGISASLRYKKQLTGGPKYSLIGSIGMDYLSSDKSDYYFGVKESEATPARPAYTPDDALNGFVGLSGRYMVNNRWSVFANGGYTLLDERIKESPVVDSDGLFSGFVGAGYRFSL